MVRGHLNSQNKGHKRSGHYHEHRCTVGNLLDKRRKFTIKAFALFIELYPLLFARQTTKQATNCLLGILNDLSCLFFLLMLQKYHGKIPYTKIPYTKYHGNIPDRPCCSNGAAGSIKLTHAFVDILADHVIRARKGRHFEYNCVPI